MTFIKNYIKLDQAPGMLQEKVKQEMEQLPYTKLLCVTKVISSPYKDKNIIETRYTAHVQSANYYEVFKFSECTHPEWADRGVRSSGMLASEILEFVKHDEWLLDDIRRMENAGG